MALGGNNLRFALWPLLVFASVAASNASAEEGPSVGLQAGWSLPSNISLHSKAGANWMIDPVLRLQLDYRFRSVLGTSHTYGNTPVDFGSLSSHSVMLSVRWLLVAPR